jgi:outer membrane protein assembly factor BamA
MRMIKHWFGILLVFSLTPLAALAVSPPADSTLIEAILFIGNDHTREEILTREMQLQPGDPFEARIAEQDRQRIENLHLFTRVEMQLLPGSGGVIVMFLLSERWYIFPYPLLFIHDRDWGKLSYGAGLRQENFRGRNITLLGNFWFGYNPSFHLSYTNPWIHGRHKLSFSSQIYYSVVENLSPEYNGFDEKHRGAALGLGKRLGFFARTSAGIGYREVRLPAGLGLTRSADGLDRIAQASISCRYDDRDYTTYPKRGWFVDAGVALNMVAGESDYLFTVCDLRRYQPLFAGLSLAGRARVDWSKGKVPVYDRIYIGYSERVRGHFSEVVEGEGRILASAELRWPLLKPHYFNLAPEDKEYGAYLRNLPFAMHAALFYDGGLMAGRDWSRREQRRLGGFGMGVAAQLPYVELVRFERAWNLDGRGEYIIDMKVWF